MVISLKFSFLSCFFMAGKELMMVMICHVLMMDMILIIESTASFLVI